MKKFKGLIALTLCVLMVSSVSLMTACDSKANETSEPTVESEVTEDADEPSETTSAPEIDTSTLGMRIYAEFLNAVNEGKDLPSIIEIISDSDVTEYDCLSMDVEAGYLNGFDDQISGFTSATMISPVIGSVPFVVYVFESDNPSALKDELLAHADPRWNICTEADETVCEVSGNYVFFCMVPNE